MSRCDNCGSDRATSQVVIYTIREMGQTTRWDGPDKVTTTTLGEAMQQPFQVCARCIKRHEIEGQFGVLGALLLFMLSMILVGVLHWQATLAWMVLLVSVTPLIVMLARTIGFWKPPRLAKKIRSKLQPQATLKVISADKYNDLQRGSTLL